MTRTPSVSTSAGLGSPAAPHSRNSEFATPTVKLDPVGEEQRDRASHAASTKPTSARARGGMLLAAEEDCTCASPSNRVTSAALDKDARAAA